MTTMRRRTSLLSITAVVACLAITFAATGAEPTHAHHNPGHGGGPGGGGEDPPTPPPPVDGGTIYYMESGSPDDEVHSIQPDGSGDTLLSLGNDDVAFPSATLHAGERWFVTIRPSSNSYSPGFFPGGASDGRLFELDLIRDGNPTPIELTNNGDNCIQMWGRDPGVRFGWTYGPGGQMDGAIAWVGSRWEDVDSDGSCDQPIDGGIFRGSISIDTAGNVSFIQPTAPEIDVPLETSGGLNGTSTRASELAFAPDGQRVAYTDSNGRDLWVVDELGNRTMIFDGRPYDLDWSPDGSRIAFTGAVSKQNGADASRGTYTIAVDGSDLRQVADAKIDKKPSDPFIFHDTVHWSPTGAQILFTERISTLSPTSVQRTLYRVHADGSGQFEISPNPDGAFGLGWAVD